MSETKTYVLPDSGCNSGMFGLLAPMLQQRGLDPNMVMAMMNNRNGFGGEGGWFIWIIFLFFLMGWNRNGFGNGNGEGFYPFANMLNNDTGRELVVSAVQGNSAAISQLAQTLNCDVNSIQNAIQNVSSQICQVGNQAGLSSQQVINAIQQGNMSIAQQLSTCCCNIRESVTRMGYENQIANLNQTNQLQNAINNVATGQERGFSQVAYESQAQTCALQNTINSGIQKIIDGQAAAELRELHGIISKQNDELSSFKTAGIISQQLAPISSALVGLKSELDSVKCQLPNTVTLPANTSVAVPTCVAAQAGLYGAFGNYGYWG